MKFVALGNSPNISASRHVANKISMQLDSRGLPHICWLEVENGHNEMHYKFWDGLQWTYHNNPMVGWVEEELIVTNNAIVLGEDEKPNIVFSRRLPNSQSVITLSKPHNESWMLDELEVNYDIKWIGVVKYDYSVLFSSSSSSSTSLSSSSSSSSESNSSSSSIYLSSSSSKSSSSSIDLSSSSSSSNSSSSNNSSSSSSNSSSSSLDSSSSSSSSNSSSSSSSNLYTSSSSSIDSSSSSSADDARIFVVTLSSDSTVRIYGITSNGWNLLSEKSTFSDNSNASPESLKIIQCSKYIAIVWQSEDVVNYNFFDIHEEKWVYNTSQDITIDGLICVGIDAYGFEDDGIIVMSSVEKSGSEVKIVNRTISSNGIISSFGTPIVESEDAMVYGNNDFLSSGYTKINIAANYGMPIIVAIGARMAKYTFNGSLWTKEYISMEGMGNGFYIEDFVIRNHNELKIALSINGKDVYFLKEDVEAEAFSMVSPQMTILNSQRLFISTWEDTEIKNGSQIRCTWYCRVGDILREGLTRVNVIVADQEDPECYTSSSSSSQSSSSSTSQSNSTSISESSDSTVSESSISEDSSESSATSDSSPTSDGYSSLSSPESETF